MQKFSTPLQDLVTVDDSTAAFNPLTGAINSAEFEEVRFRCWFNGANGVRVVPGIQFSDDGIDWTSYSATAISGTYSTVSSDGWLTWLTFQDLFTSYTPKLFVRFGIFTKNTSGTSKARSAQCRMVVEAKPVQSKTMALGPIAVNTGASTSTWVFHAMSGAIPTGDMGEARATLAFESLTGDIEAKAAVQFCDEPEDPKDWASTTDLTSSVSSATIEFGTTFTDVSSSTASYDWARFGVRVKNVSSTDIECALAQLRIEYRR